MIILTGDFNGSPKGAVFELMTSQNFHSAQQDYWTQKQLGSSKILLDKEDDYDIICDPSYSNPEHNGNVWNTWVSHKSHRNQIIPVDHVFYLNPSDQVEARLPVLPDWTNLVFREVYQRIVAEVGTDNMRELFSAFDQDKSNFVTPEEFKAELNKLGFQGDGSPALTPEEIQALIDSADRNGDGEIIFL